MKNRLLILTHYIFLLAACTPPVATPTMIHTDEPSPFPTEIPAESPT